LRIILEATCGLCGKKQHVTPDALTSENPGERVNALRCPHCNNKLTDSEHLRALGGFLSAVTHKRKHVAPAFHAAKILMTVLEKHHPWRLGIRVLPEVRTSVERRMEVPIAASEGTHVVAERFEDL
jgi:hypothetical protein